ncbi:MAG: hypothetical protein A3H61_00820 [Candidatus Jacksonbacteria bacterium RIFCSPLOWO2_02_FULL_44_20]|uniref:Uncharacterized protein n=1 Tax=Candidatus Jacksonbacteria bacterium RIFCSPLOWO2_02_FULL_44_20 TaxID=1798460 RepID=A0A1G2A6K9_9BACT|nr:MAG: hypothetical protein A3C00_04030 [Candidatus Jacksonbacteria bacterium RIFCSPHIGHO2_02_FULL_44_25]OGY72190.1 MAG: hypothetical protein A3E05_01335 [Candidatus Jacksonbacteria bacterium RIFCSPHIGHO2_12_FULL_44_12]OGY72309.1 MAG: hypothetical protein A3H61_00820 [Candidatus Jacksonbacteria bacterium RIFCSPLOWO2_02_FULL_44_20]OGY73251.1 MAG: hypothetical protein A3H07_03950 [Candidatus Jacksonbacteria bacterium RIFCSPLOWO2_12_FULL_44_15b]
MPIFISRKIHLSFRKRNAAFCKAFNSYYLGVYYNNRNRILIILVLLFARSCQKPKASGSKQ